MPGLELSVTICSWNTLEDTRACLRSLEAIRNEASFEVILVDNNSEDKSAEMVRDEFPWVRLEAMSHNLGFVLGHNHALTLKQGRHVLFLNSDTIVHPGALRTMLDYLESASDVGIVGPKLLNPDGTLQYSCRKFPNPLAALFRNTPLGRMFPNNRFTRDYLMQDWSHDQPRDVDWVSGAALLARDALLDKIGGFDPIYIMYLEDVDLAWRTHAEGYRVVYLPTAVITHAIGRSTDKAPNRMIGRFHKSMLVFYAKNMLPTMMPIVRPFAFAAAACAIGLRAGMFIAKNKVDDLRRRSGR